MKELRFKFIGGTALLIILCVLFYRIQFAGNASVAVSQNLTQRHLDVYDIEQEMERQEEHQIAIENELVDSKISTVQLCGEALKAMEGNDDFDSTRRKIIGQNQAVIHLIADEIRLIQSMPTGLQIDPAKFDEEKGWFMTKDDDENTYIIYYYKMSETSFFVEWEDFEKSFTFNYFLNGNKANKREIEEALGIYILQFAMVEDENMTKSQPIYASDFFSDYKTAADFGITQEMFNGATETSLDRFADSADTRTLEGGQSLTIKGKQYDCYFRKKEDQGTITVFMIPSDQPIVRAAERTGLLLAAFAIVGFSFLTWVLSIYSLVIRHKLNEEQKKTFLPRIILRRAAIYIMLGLLVIAGISVFLQCLFTSSNVGSIAERTLRSIETHLDSNRAMANEYQQVRMKTYEEFAGAVGLLAASNVDRMDAAMLDDISETIGADYIIIFDETGTQVMSNTQYSRLTLFDGGEDIEDFSRLLKGVSPISKAQVTDAQTSRTHAIFGVSLPRGENDGRNTPYWALLMFVNPDRIASMFYMSTEEIMRSVDSSNTMCFSVDPESGRILASSEPEFNGKTAVSLGLPQEALSDHYMGFFRMDGTRMYGMSDEKDGILYYYIVNQQRMYQNVPQNAFRAVLLYLCLMVVLAAFLLFGYKKTFDRYADKGEELREVSNLVMTPSGKFKLSIDPSSRWAISESAYGSPMPIYNAISVAQVIYLAAVIIIALYTRFGNVSADNSAIAYIMSDRWTKGFNLFAITNILILFIEVSVVTIIVRFLIRTATRYVGTKGETIGRLMIDFAGYLSFIIFAYYALSFIGINTSALVASLGIITFALSLGAQDLIKDILAGLTIVLDGEYQVGDIVDINGFRGTVLEVGVRTTKIEGRGGNILIVGNRDVKNVVNRTRKNSWYALEVSISENEDLGKVEALLKERLPRIGEDIPEIISGPFYKGVVNMGKSTLSLSIIAECVEDDYYQVQRKLNGAVAVLFDEAGISIK